MKGNDGWPQAVYLETSILRQLPIDVTTAELLRLREICKTLDIPTVIPMVAFNEWTANRKSDFIEKARSYETATERMTTLKEKYLIDIELPSFDSLISPKDKETICNEIETMLISRLREIGVIITETPNIALDLLLKMSIDKIRPFEEKGEKGFRDSVILFTVLEFAKKSPEGFHLLVTNDGAYDHEDVYERASSENVKIVIKKSITDAIEYLDEFISVEIKKYHKKRAANLEKFLYEHKEKIAEFIRSQKSFINLFPRFGPERSVNPEDIKAITSINFLSIHDSTPGTLPEGKNKERVKISFLAKVEFDLIINEQYFLNALSSLMYGPEFQFQEEKGAWTPQQKYVDLQPREVEKKIERDLKIEASAMLSADTDQYSELQLERIV